MDRNRARSAKRRRALVSTRRLGDATVAATAAIGAGLLVTPAAQATTTSHQYGIGCRAPGQAYEGPTRTPHWLSNLGFAPGLSTCGAGGAEGWIRAQTWYVSFPPGQGQDSLCQHKTTGSFVIHSVIGHSHVRSRVGSGANIDACVWNVRSLDTKHHYMWGSSIRSF